MPLEASQPRRCGMAEILLSIKARLVAWPVVRDTAAIGILARRQTPHLKAEQLVFLRPGSFLSKQSENDGAGRVHTQAIRVVEVLINNRISLDRPDTDQQWLVDGTRGYFVPEETVLDALQDFFPEDSSGNLLLVEPMRILGGEFPDTEKDKPGWGDGLLKFEIRYLPDLDQAYQ